MPQEKGKLTSKRDRNHFIRENAIEILKKLHKVLRNEKGHSLKAKEFFPVDLKKVINIVIGWKFDHVSLIGVDDYIQKIKGYCNFKDKIICIADADFGVGEENFTIAHEIGHAVLHKNSYIKPTELLRKRSVRRIINLTTSSEQRKMDREANIFATELLMPENAVRNQFHTIFKKNSLWIGSPKIKKIVEEYKREVKIFKNNCRYPEDFAKYLAVYREPSSGLSIRDFFNVTRSAMSRRLLELELLY